jgi:hypothetical protein
MPYIKMSTAGCGAEAAIGQLTRLTSLHLSVDRRKDSPDTTLQLQLLDCSGAASGSDGGRSGSGSGSGRSSARSSMGLQELSLECIGPLAADELAAAAAALPDLRRLEVSGHPYLNYGKLQGLVGSGLAAFGACQRLRNVLLRRCEDLEGQQLVMQLPQISSLASIQIENCWRVDSSVVGELQAAFRREHGRTLRVEIAARSS